jgi:hypothetical protein
MKLDLIWIVTTPYDNESTLQDICFSCDAYTLMLQFRGGLSSDNIEAMFSTKEEAEVCALKLLDNVQ